MPSYEYQIDERARAGSRLMSRVSEEIQHALVTEKATRKLTQQSIADKLGVNRSVVNRWVMGLENMTVRSVGELLWAIGWEPMFEARKSALHEGENEFSSQKGAARFNPPNIDSKQRPTPTSGTGQRAELRNA